MKSYWWSSSRDLRRVRGLPIPSTFALFAKGDELPGPGSGYCGFDKVSASPSAIFAVFVLC
jgi:hypothetical protein